MAMLSIEQLLAQLEQIGKAQLAGHEGWGFRVAVIGVKAMRLFNDSAFPEICGVMSYRQHHWYNLQAELQNMRRILEKRGVEIPAKLKAALEHYCTCDMPEGY